MRIVKELFEKIKRIGVFFFILVIISSCGGGDDNSSSSAESQLPDRLYLSVALPEIAYDALPVFCVSRHIFDDETLIQALMTDVPDSEEEMPGGSHYIVRETEHLYIGHETEGGFGYYKDLDLTSANIDRTCKELATKYTPASNDRAVFTFANDDMKAFPEGEMTKLSRKKALEKAADVLSSCGINDIRLHTYTYRDKETLAYNLSVYNQRYKERYGSDEGTYSYEFSKNEEDYLLTFQRTIAGIPVCDQQWQKDSGAFSVVNTIQVTINKEGEISEAVVSDHMDLEESLGPIEIAPFEQALAAFAADYDKALHFYDTEIVSVELEYVIISKDNVLTAVPAWVFVTKASVDEANKAEETSYDIIAFHAGTLEKLMH